MEAGQKWGMELGRKAMQKLQAAKAQEGHDE